MSLFICANNEMKPSWFASGRVLSSLYQIMVGGLSVLCLNKEEPLATEYAISILVKNKIISHKNILNISEPKIDL